MLSTHMVISSADHTKV